MENAWRMWMMVKLITRCNLSGFISMQVSILLIISLLVGHHFTDNEFEGSHYNTNNGSSEWIVIVWKAATLLINASGNNYNRAISITTWQHKSWTCNRFCTHATTQNSIIRLRHKLVASLIAIILINYSFSSETRLSTHLLSDTFCGHQQCAENTEKTVTIAPNNFPPVVVEFVAPQIWLSSPRQEGSFLLKRKLPPRRIAFSHHPSHREPWILSSSRWITTSSVRPSPTKVFWWKFFVSLRVKVWP